MEALTTMLDSFGHEPSRWPQLSDSDPNFATTYHLLEAGTSIVDFHLQDGFLCHLGHLCAPSSESVNMIWEAHYSQVVGHFGMEKTMAVVKKYFYWSKLQ